MSGNYLVNLGSGQRVRFASVTGLPTRNAPDTSGHVVIGGGVAPSIQGFNTWAARVTATDLPPPSLFIAQLDASSIMVHSWMFFAITGLAVDAQFGGRTSGALPIDTIGFDFRGCSYR